MTTLLLTPQFCSYLLNKGSDVLGDDFFSRVLNEQYAIQLVSQVLHELQVLLRALFRRYLRHVHDEHLRVI